MMTQPDLFGQQQPDRAEPTALALEEPPADFVDRIRSELDSTLRTVREAPVLPWQDLTRATLAQLRFHSISRWLPDQEAVALCAEFEAEMDRIYTWHDDGIPAPK